MSDDFSDSKSPFSDLFGDEDENVASDSLEVKNATIDRKLMLDPNNTMVIGKFPRTVCMTLSPLDEEEELESLQRKAELLVCPPELQDTVMMRWRFNENDSNDGDNLETNTHLVEWENGTLTLFIGNASFDIDIARDKSYVLEDSQEIKPFHAAVDLRLQARQSNLCQGRKIHNFKFEHLRKQRVNLTSHEHVMKDELKLQKRINQSFNKSDMNIQFLESDS